MTEFPSTTERTVASSLLLLPYAPVFISPTRSNRTTNSLGSVEKSSYVSKWREEGSSNLSLILKSTGSESFGSALSSDGNVESLIRDLSTCSVDSKEESSCLSTGSSEVTTTASRSKLRNQKSHERVRVEVKKKESSRSSSIRRRANDILEFLSSASASEVQIRQILGNTPDTSKALRILLCVLESVDYSYRLTVLIKPSATMQVVEDEGSKEVWHGGKT
ncbi:hypothetical protein IGI04_037769 [Brassica rapa subsp. trilocularis]|uniref:HTH three-helical bundle domain-containing protein n=1 Tax=Brassica rapa subsp. trilocularis TaxID=1813537 RepID=A0ABQ7LIB5_BRACM|nr:hypothetical protein IGI04_037769 [Brassica rapa subsp. trilocularis]